MYCDKNFYMCKNLLFWESTDLSDYICTLTGVKCNCKTNDFNCTIFEVDEEE